jgi:hypothetical protein
MTTALS